MIDQIKNWFNNPKNAQFLTIIKVTISIIINIVKSIKQNSQTVVVAGSIAGATSGIMVMNNNINQDRLYEELKANQSQIQAQIEYNKNNLQLSDALSDIDIIKKQANILANEVKKAVEKPVESFVLEDIDRLKNNLQQLKNLEIQANEVNKKIVEIGTQEALNKQELIKNDIDTINKNVNTIENQINTVEENLNNIKLNLDNKNKNQDDKILDQEVKITDIQATNNTQDIEIVETQNRVSTLENNKNILAQAKINIGDINTPALEPNSSGISSVQAISGLGTSFAKLQINLATGIVNTNNYKVIAIVESNINESDNARATLVLSVGNKSVDKFEIYIREIYGVNQNSSINIYVLE